MTTNQDYIGTYPCVVCTKKVRVYDWLPQCVLCTQCEKEADELEERMKGSAIEGPSDELNRLRAENEALRKRVADLEWGNEMACENTPNPACECPGCETARERAARGESGPSAWEYRCEACGVNLADVEVDGKKLPRVRRCDCCLPKRTEGA